MSITAVVPVWNGREHLQRLLASLDAQTKPAAGLLVIDNGSTDGAPDLARRHGARVIPMGRNAGFAAAVNRGIRECHTEWIAVLNSDVELAPDYFELLSSTTHWFATGKILQRSGSCLDAAFDLTCRGGTTWRAGSGRTDSAVFNSSRPIYSAPWTAALFRTELFRLVGLLEESFESYLEDVDFGLRCAAHQLAGIYEPAAIAWHVGSASLGLWHSETVRRIARNQVLLLARHYPPPVLRRCLWHILVAQLLWGAVAARHGRAASWLRGKIQGLRQFSSARPSCEPPPFDLFRHFQADERAIRETQQLTGFDPYWKLYFRLTGAGAK